MNSDKDMTRENQPLRYQDAGVDIEKGNEAVNRIRPWALKTARKEVLSGVGGFAGAFELQEPSVLLAGADGVGSKLMIAEALQQFDTIGIDLVAMNVNDILAQGGEPLFFLDYIATHQIVPEQIELLVKGIAQGCLESGCALLGGETAELPDLYQPSHFDLAGFCVGRMVHKPTEPVQAGDQILGIASSGFHSNGYALLRRIVSERHLKWDQLYPATGDQTLGQALLTPTRIYVKAVEDLWQKVSIKAMAHITGGGLIENVPRTLPDDVIAVIDKSSWTMSALMQWFQELGPVSDDEWYRTFNAGIGFTVVLAQSDVTLAQSVLAQHGLASYVIGHIEVGHGERGVKWA